MAEWKKFTGSEEQIKEMNDAEHGWIVRFINGVEANIRYNSVDKALNTADITEYLICEPHPHAEMIHRWADTGQPVYSQNADDLKWHISDLPCWNRDVKYSFNPPKEKKFIEVKEYLCKSINDGSYYTATITKGEKSDSVTFTEQRKIFVRWIDDDWRQI